MKYKLILEIETEEPCDMLVEDILEGSWLYSQDNETMVVTRATLEKEKGEE